MPRKNQQLHLLTQLTDAMELFSRGVATADEKKFLRSVGRIKRDDSFREWTLVAPIETLAKMLGKNIPDTEAERQCRLRGIPISYDGKRMIAEINRFTRGPSAKE